MPELQMWIFSSKMLLLRQVYVWTLPGINRYVDIPPYLASTARYVAFVVFWGGGGARTLTNGYLCNRNWLAWGNLSLVPSMRY